MTLSGQVDSLPKSVQVQAGAERASQVASVVQTDQLLADQTQLSEAGRTQGGEAAGPVGGTTGLFLQRQTAEILQRPCLNCSNTYIC